MTIHTVEAGSDSGPAIVLLHGGGGAGWMWQPVIAHLQDYHLLVPDLPAHGESLSVPFTMQSAAAQVARLVQERVPGGRAHLVGLSLGAQVLVALLAANPQVVLSAVVSSALLRPLPGAGLGLYSKASAQAIYWSSIAPFKQWDAWVRLNMKHSAGIPSAFFPQFKRDFQRMTPESWASILYENAHFRQPAGLERVQAPVLVLAGSKEYAPMRRSAQELAAALPNARLADIPAEPGWSLAQQHNWALTAPERFAELVRDWVAAAEAPAV